MKGRVVHKSFFAMILTYSFSLTAMGQILFAEECYKGGVMAVGINVDNGVATHHVPFHWQEHYNFRKAFVVTYRYGRPAPHTMRVNGVDVNWGNHNQVSPELPEMNEGSKWSAFHVQPLDFIPDIESGILELVFPEQNIYPAGNWGWSSMYLVIYFDSPEITREVCSRMYISDKRQDMAQTYILDKPPFLESKPLLLSIFASRLSSFYSDRTTLEMNGDVLGSIWGDDLLNTNSTQGHFYYENREAYGLNNDTANTSLQQYDGIAIINEYMNNSNNNQLLFLNYPEPLSHGRSNLHPAFVLAYTPACAVPESEVVRRHTVCRGESVELQAAGYDNYIWSPGDAMNDSTLANPVLVPDSSRWYRVSMWDDDGTACPQTIPVYVEVEDIPRPQDVEVVYSLCTNNTGRIEVSSVPGKAPWAFYLNGQYRDNGNFAGLSPGEYTLEITTALGCSWDTLLTVPMKHLQTAAFTRSEEHTSELQSRPHLVCRLLLEKKNNILRQKELSRSRAALPSCARPGRRRVQRN